MVGKKYCNNCTLHWRYNTSSIYGTLICLLEFHYWGVGVRLWRWICVRSSKASGAVGGCGTSGESGGKQARQDKILLTWHNKHLQIFLEKIQKSTSCWFWCAFLSKNEITILASKSEGMTSGYRDWWWIRFQLPLGQWPTAPCASGLLVSSKVCCTISNSSFRRNDCCQSPSELRTYNLRKESTPPPTSYLITCA